jgi:methyltransferase-like protein/2-polyprenyl-3-methyl-5-hydroxy-6-metoxy-1,4-benzoquinol methylase
MLIASINNIYKLGLHCIFIESLEVMYNSESDGAQLYDELPYDSHTYPRSHPRNLQAVATVMGVDAPPAENCRVLELGCAEGGNLVPMAWDLPASRFVGIDYSQRQIQEGEALRSDLGLSNLELRCLSITDMDEVPGEFDYIICHGVYSWVPVPVQEKILEICATRLTSSGVAYISYNTFPGWRFQGVIRELLLMECGKIASPTRAVEKAQALIKYLGDILPAIPGSTVELLRQELRRLRDVRPSYLFHDYLETCNEPVDFQTFVESLKAFGLSYLGEAQYSAMAHNTLPPELLSWIGDRTDDLILTEQYLDYFNMRCFRQSLITQSDTKKAKSIVAEQLSDLYISGRLSGADPVADSSAAMTVNFVGETGGTLTTDSTVVKAALGILSRNTNPLPFNALLKEALKIATVLPNYTLEASNGLASSLVYAFGKELLDIKGGMPPYVSVVSERPQASALARHMCSTNMEVANLRHEMVRLSDLERAVLILADGTRSRRELLDGIMASRDNGSLTVSHHADSSDTALATQTRDALLRLSSNALLVR